MRYSSMQGRGRLWGMADVVLVGGILVGLSVGLLGGCRSGVVTPGISRWEAAAGPFVPVALRVHPLTHVQIGDDDRASIVLHVELRDRWGDAVKGVGVLDVQLLRPSGAREVQELRWSVDLRDLGENAASYDPSTRTYRFALVDVPVWVRGLAADPRAGNGGGEGERVSRLKLIVVLESTDELGAPSRLSDEYTIEQ